MTPDFFNRSILSRQLWTFRRLFLWVGIFSMIANVLMLAPTLYMLQVYGRVMKSGSELTLFMVTLFLILFYVVMAFAEWLRSRLLVRAGVQLDEALNSLVFNASFEAFLTRSTHKISEAFQDLANIRQFLTANGIIAFFDTPWTPIYIAVIFLLSPFLGCLSILFAIIQLLVTLQSHLLTRREIELASEAGNESYRYVQSKLRNIEPIHAMGMSGNLMKRWFVLNESSLEKAESSHDRQHRQQAWAKFFRYTMQSLTLGAGALLVVDGRMSAGSMIAANVLMSKALQPLDLVVATWKPFVHSLTAFTRLEKLLEEFPEQQQGGVHQDPFGEIRIESLTVRVEGRKMPILDNIQVMFPPGKVVVVLGPSGSGKSTLARCIVGVWPHPEGAVLIDGDPIENWERAELGPHLGYLPQDIELFDGSIAENIARFAEIDSLKVIEAARRTGIHEMILSFPRGYDTQIGEAGGMLSGGQRQRLGLARAIYGNPAILVLDEPNANLDEAGERSLLQAVGDMKAAGKTVILITHRPSILGAADLVAVMKAGRIERCGPREEVIAAMRPAAVSTSAVQAS
ncbi:type I secretion system permease/ATPase [Chlorobium sp. KB01]|uniref:type I secretion system permease/ATPase n=1 Tax=Chlorobium sp. KB01 TaxID=1917528 RepID=UPI000976A1C4|nr:type I secretion system permease/ATPase [Chlorobium sp. KB01]